MNRRVHRDQGFTLVELMASMLILGILATIALSTFSRQKSKAYESTLKASLRDAAGAQELWSSENGGYTDDVGLLTGVGFRTTDGVDLSASVTGSAFCIAAEHVPSGQRLYFTNAGDNAGRPTPDAC